MKIKAWMLLVSGVVGLLIGFALFARPMMGFAQSPTDTPARGGMMEQMHGSSETMEQMHAQMAGMHGDMEAMHAQMGQHHDSIITIAAEQLDMTVEELTAALEGGKSIAQLAEERGLTTGPIIDAIVADHLALMTEHMGTERAAAMEAQMKGHLAERLTEAGFPLNHTPGDCDHEGMGGMHGSGGMGGMHGHGPQR